MHLSIKFCVIIKQFIKPVISAVSHAAGTDGGLDQSAHLAEQKTLVFTLRKNIIFLMHIYTLKQLTGVCCRHFLLATRYHPPVCTNLV